MEGCMTKEILSIQIRFKFNKKLDIFTFFLQYSEM